MASEKKGKTYEALVVAAARKLVAHNKGLGKVFWNQKPIHMFIEPDVVIGRRLDAPIAIVLVTHSASEKNSNQKFWRNIGELVEAKTRLASQPMVGNFVFDAAFKPDLNTIQAHTFDWEARISEEPWWGELQTWIDRNVDSLPKDSEEKLGALVDAAKNTPVLRSGIRKLEVELKRLVSATVPKELAALWSMQRSRTPPSAPSARTTHVRRGLGKCLVIPSILGSERTWREGKLDAEDGPIAVALGLGTACIGGIYRVTDREVLSTSASLSLTQARRILARQPTSRMRVWIDPLRDLGAIADQFAWVVEHWAQLSNPEFLFRALRRCHEDPRSLGPRGAKGVSRVWLYHLLLDILKTVAAKKQAYGLAALLDDLKRLRENASHRRVVGALSRTAGVTSVSWRDDRGISLGLGDWANGPSAQRFPLYPDDLARVAAALSLRVSSSTAAPAMSALSELVETVVSTNLEAKLLPYRLFDPVRAQIELALEDAKLAHRFIANMPACFADRVRSLEALDPRSGGTAVIQSKKTVINWQSAHESHTNDKRKELTGRALALRFEWRGKQSVFDVRGSSSKLVLVLDGTWEQSDLNALLAAGWDDIFYPDEMDKLVKAIV